MERSYTQNKKFALGTIILLGVITVIEVLIALVGKGYIFDGITLPLWIMGILMISLSLYKAYKIVFEFMHMGHEVRGLRLTVLLPMLLLVWAVIAFFNEGNAWLNYRDKIQQKDNIESAESIQVQSIPDDIKR